VEATEQVFCTMTLITKSSHGEWRAEDTEMLNDTLELSITTMRRSNGRVTTTATVGRREGVFITHLMYQDYNVSLWAVVYPRVTRKVVEEQHKSILKELVAIRQRARDHYKLDQKEPTNELPSLVAQDATANG